MPDIFIPPQKSSQEMDDVPSVQMQPEQKNESSPKPGPEHSASAPSAHAIHESSASPFSSYYEHPGNVSFQTQEDDEYILLFLRRHLITNLPWIVTSLILMLFPLLFLLINALLPFIDLFPGFSLSTEYWILITLFYYLVVAAFIFARFIDWFYNVSIVTQKRIVDIDYSNLISHDIAITKVTLIEDVRYTQMGFVQSLFNYGDVYVQTAGKHQNFDFIKVPKPARATTIIEDLIGRKKNDH